jgi:hypothetical protein
VSIVKEKMDQLSKDIDSLKTKDKDVTYNNTEVFILRKSYLKEAIEFPDEITASFKADRDIQNANERLKKYVNDLIS